MLHGHRDGAQRPVAGGQGHDHCGTRPDRPEQSEVVGITGHRAEHLVADVGVIARLAAAENGARSHRGLRIDGVVLLQGPEHLRLGRVGVGHDHLAQGTAVQRQVDDAPVGQAGHDQLGQVRQGGLVVERGGQDGRGLGQEGQRGDLGAITRRDPPGDDVGGGHPCTSKTAKRGPPLLDRTPLHCARSRWLPKGQRAGCRVVSRRRMAPVLREERPGRPRCARPRGACR